MKNAFNDIIASALAEDLGAGDITTNTLMPPTHVSQANVVFKSKGVVCGLDIAKSVFKKVDPAIAFNPKVKEGALITKKTIIATIRGRTKSILTAERVTLNFLSHLSSIATNTRQFVDAVKPYKVAVMDTRKTTPTLRTLDRYAVKTGGGVNHRFDLSEMAMIKDNHYVLDQDPIHLVDRIRRMSTKKIILEVDTLNQLERALTSRADVILLDNMNIAQTKKAVAMRNKINKSILLESSGGINLKTIKKYAACGVDRISIGSLTQTRVAVDIGLDILI